MKSSPLLTAVQAFCEREAVRDRPLVVAVSGGPDSLALLYALHRLALQPLIAAHLNHQLRGEESNADQAFVEQFCAHHRIAFRGEQVDVRAQAPALGRNVESAARKLRYDWLARTAAEHSAPWVATGHTADDQAETVLHNLLRGTGLRGLRGIAPRRELRPGVEVVRPLLTVSREQVEAFLREHQLTACVDRTNLDPALTRARIRHRLLPLLRNEFNPQVVSVLGRLAEQSAEVCRLQEALARELLAAAERPRAGRVIVLDVAPLARAPRQLVREVFRVVWEREGWPLSPMDFAGWDRLAGLVFAEGRVLDMPGHIRARRKGMVVQLARR
jgi:tRNA(Ile)-lysidine synthase